MRQEEAFFGEQDLALLYIAKRLKEARRLEDVLDEAGVDYLVEADTYRGGFLFVSERIGAFFYTSDALLNGAHEAMKRAGFVPYDPAQGS
jgi:prenyltransferase beta subunit